jgi:hypothetical protein
MKYTIFTQIDITKSNPLRDDPSTLKQGQQANFNSLRQAIELRAIIVDDSNPRVIERDNETWWQYDFTTDRGDEFLVKNNPVGLLVDDIDGIPFISGLNSSVGLEQSVFKTKGKNPNTTAQIIE